MHPTAWHVLHPGEHLPVCADGVTYSNRCEAERAGYHGLCATKVSSSSCDTSFLSKNILSSSWLYGSTSCPTGHYMSEKEGVGCVVQPRRTYSFAFEKILRRCTRHPWVKEHCSKTCA